MNGSQKTYSWGFLKTLTSSLPVYRWESLKGLREKSRLALIPRIQEYRDLQNQWVMKLRPLCEDQETCDWNKFRPLRLNREEDWSNWLAWLLETSKTGVFAGSLFANQMNCVVKSFGSPTVDREVSADDRRADIVAKWNTRKVSHVEVKLWDKNFDKTFETARKLRLQYDVLESDWSDFILIPREYREDWCAVAQAHSADGTPKINFVLWDDVVHGLRNCLWSQRESVFWRAWAWTFCSMIENRILRLSKIGKQMDRTNPLQAQMALRWLNVLNPKFVGQI